MKNTWPKLFPLSIKNCRRSLDLFAALASVLFITGCAQVSAPNGGPIDKTPPKVVRYMPDSAATNFSGKEIEITFDEYIQLKDLQNELNISPALATPPEITVRSNKILNVKFNEMPEPNTTYVLNFGRSIRDIREDNAKENFLYVFSTGSSIDTLYISGKIVDAENQTPVQDVIVGLYDAAKADSVVFKEKAKYYARSNKDGSFRISYLKPGNYKCVAIKDANRNFTFDANEESIGFTNSTVSISKPVTDLQIEIFKQTAERQKLKSAQMLRPGYFLFTFSKPVSDLVLKPIFPNFQSPWSHIEYGKDRDTVHYWFTGIDADTIITMVFDDKALVDTARLTKPLGGKGGGNKNYFKLEGNAKLKNATLDYQQPLKIKFTHPIKTLDNSRLSLYMGKIAIACEVSRKEGAARIIDIKANYIADSTYTVIALPGFATDFFGVSHDTIKTTFRIQPLEDYGSMLLKYEFNDGSKRVIQLVNEKGIIARSFTADSKGEYQFTLLEPGVYAIRAVNDSNGNGRWDAGNYLRKIQPEKVDLSPKQITIRANWDADLEWKK